MTPSQKLLRDKLLGNLDLLQRLRAMLEDYSVHADPDKGAEDIIRIVAEYGRLNEQG